MGLLDPIADALAQTIKVSRALIRIFDPDEAIEGAQEYAEGVADDTDELLENVLGGVFEELEEDVKNEITERGYLTPDNVGPAVLGAEGAAIEDGIVGIASGLAIELAGATQLESHQFALSQILSFMALEDVLGRELGMLYEKGVDPALEAKIARETRSEYVSLQDHVEYELRTRSGDEGWLEGVATYGVRPDEVHKLEEVSLEAVEAEELLESPIQFGVVPDPDLVRRNAKRAGLPEEVMELFVETAEAAPRSADMWEQRTALEPVISQYDTLVDDGEVSPVEARQALPAEADEAADALQDRWEGIDDLPAGSPTRGQLESWFGWGLINRQSLADGLRRTDVDPEEYPAVIGENILEELDGDLRTALGLGIIDENYYTSLCRSVGIEQDVIRDLLSGADLDDIGKSKASEDVPLGERPTTVINQIGTSRAAGLEGRGIETVADLAAADPETVADGAYVNLEAAKNLISRAQTMVS